MTLNELLHAEMLTLGPFIREVIIIIMHDQSLNAARSKKQQSTAG